MSLTSSLCLVNHQICLTSFLDLTVLSLSTEPHPSNPIYLLFPITTLQLRSGHTRSKPFSGSSVHTDEMPQFSNFEPAFPVIFPIFYSKGLKHPSRIQVLFTILSTCLNFLKYFLLGSIFFHFSALSGKVQIMDQLVRAQIKSPLFHDT